MGSKQGDFTTLIINPDKRSNGNFKSILKKYLFHWPLFIVGLALSITAATVYINMVKPNYEIKASILIKDDKKGADGPQAAMMHEIGLANSSEGVENEIEILKSKKLIGQVVNDLQLWVSYKKKDGLIYDDLYNDSPVKLTSLVPSQTLNGNTINIVIKDNKNFLFKNKGGNLDEFEFGRSYESVFGVWKIEPTNALLKYKGELITIFLSDRDKTTLSYQKLIDAGLENKLATSITLSIIDKIPQRGKNILNRLILNYNLSSTTDKNEETKSTLDFLNQRIDSLARELTTSEKGIEGFKSSRGITDISSESQIQLENMQANDKNLNEVNVKLNVIEGIDSYVNSNQNSEKAPATLGITDPALSNSIEKLSLLQLQHDKLAATMPETNPDFDPINSQIKTTKAAIRENVKNIKQSLIGTKQKLESFNSRFESSIKNMPSQERQYVNIKRQQTSKESLYTFLLQQREQVSVKSASNLANNRIVDQAYAGSPQDLTSIAYIIALVFGIGFPLSLISVRKFLTTKITNTQDIYNVLNIPIVSELPYEPNQGIIAVNEENINAVSEQLRALRIKLHYLHSEKTKGNVTLVTSSTPKEGKSFLSTNLGIALALAYKKTIILELDMRRPRIAQSLGLSGTSKGISEYLNETATKEEIIQSSKSISNLDIISCGAIINNPSELLEKPQLKELINRLKEEYDHIIIDSPPVHLVPDAVILSRLSDVCLYVIRQGFTDKAELDFIKQLSEQKQLSNINIVFNGIQRLRHGYGYKFDENYYNTRKTRRNVLAPAFANFKNRF